MTADEWRRHETCVGSDNTVEAWFACAAAEYLLARAGILQYDRGKGELSERKLRLFGCACCRLLWPYMPEAASRAAVVAAERYADGSLSADELRAACDAADRCRLPEVAPTRAAESIARADDGWPFRTHVRDIIEATLEAAEHGPFGLDLEAMEATLCELFRDIFGNPFRPVAFQHEWRTDPIRRLGWGMYVTRDFSQMPELADALRAAGCDDEAILGHCHGARLHTRGCWVVDLLLGKR